MPTSATKPTGSTWPLTLAKQLGRDDLWHAWTEGNGLPATLYWDNMVCPSNAPKKLDAHWLSYVVNCGLYKNNKNGADGVCFDQLAKPAGPKTTSDSLRAGKGTAKTLFATENTLDIVFANTDGWLQKTSAGALQFTGFCWQAVNTPNAAQQINGDKANPKPPLPKTALTDYARPASNHPGGVNVVFCDGHVQFLRDDVKYSVYQLLMATDPKKADFPAGSAAIRSLGVAVQPVSCPASQPFLPAPGLPGPPFGPAPSITSQTIFRLHADDDGRLGPKAPARGPNVVVPAHVKAAIRPGAC